MLDQAIRGLYRPGWLTFAAVVLYAVGCARVFTAIFYFADSARINDLGGGAFGHHYFIWGVWDVIIAGLAFWGGWSLLGGNTAGRIIGYLWAGLVLVQSFLILGQAPWFGFGSAALAVLVIYALAVTSGWRGEGVPPS